MYAKVLIQYGVKSLDRTFTYHVPENLETEISVGMKVYVPFGNQKINGFVIEIDNIIPEIEVKDIISIVTKELKLNEELLKLGHYVKDKTLCSLISAYQAMLPSSLKVNNSKETYDLVQVYVALNKSNEIVDEYI